LPLLLAVFALVSAPLRGDKALFALLAFLALLVAMGTPLNRLLFYAVPGYASLANPARVLGVWAFAVAALAAFGAQSLLDNKIAPATKTRGAAIALATVLLVAAWGASGAAAWAGDAVAQVPFTDLMTQATPGLMVAALLLTLSVGLLFIAPGMVAKKPASSAALLLGMILLVVADLALWGYNYNPSSKPERVYPVTPGIAWLQKNAPDARIAVINRDWTLGQTAPKYAAFPPNALTVYALHDISGYDSLFPKASKELVRAAGGGEETSPAANGNMVFVKQLETARNLGARYIVLAGDSPVDTTGYAEAYRGDDLLILESGVPGEPVIAPPSVPGSLRIGIGLAMLAGLTLAGGIALQARKPS
ncbi:MAG: hypothetical protein H7Y38_15235, partial [Armatimonadetes bacterium]|nr:hypothetical protein [Armatimonadota bacterium]